MFGINKNKNGGRASKTRIIKKNRKTMNTKLKPLTKEQLTEKLESVRVEIAILKKSRAIIETNEFCSFLHQFYKREEYLLNQLKNL